MLNLSRVRITVIFAVFALGYFLSSLVRGVTATLAPVLTSEFSLTAGQLGLLGGAYFLGFALMQLPLGNWLDRYGSKSVLLTSLVGAVVSCIAFAISEGFSSLLIARLVGGVGVSACLIAPLTAARLWLPGRMQQSVNSWMLMSGSLGLLAATLPVQWALPVFGWRTVFVILAALFLLTMLGTAWQVPARQSTALLPPARSLRQSYQPIFLNPYFQRIVFVGFANYGVLVAVQTLWAGPWMTNVAGYTAGQAARGLFAINLTMLFVFWLWAVVNPRLHRGNWNAERLMAWGLPLGIASLVAIAALGPRAGWEFFAVFCALSSFLALTHPAVGMAFPPHEAGRAISAFNLLLFLGVFVTQWCVGVGIDLLEKRGWTTTQAYQAMFAVLAIVCSASYAWFVTGPATKSRAVAST